MHLLHEHTCNEYNNSVVSNQTKILAEKELLLLVCYLQLWRHFVQLNTPSFCFEGTGYTTDYNNVLRERSSHVPLLMLLYSQGESVEAGPGTIRDVWMKSELADVTGLSTHFIWKRHIHYLCRTNPRGLYRCFLHVWMCVSQSTFLRGRSYSCVVVKGFCGLLLWCVSEVCIIDTYSTREILTRAMFEYLLHLFLSPPRFKHIIHWKTPLFKKVSADCWFNWQLISEMCSA